MGIFTTEITSTDLASDNPIHQRQLYAYHSALPYVQGRVLEIGCGNGRGYFLLKEKCDTYTAIDKNDALLSLITEEDKQKVHFINDFFPPFKGIEDASVDTLVCFQVIEHVEDDLGLLKEMYRVLKPGGKALITTPNILMSLTRNPWHVREYRHGELKSLVAKVFEKVEMMGIYGDDKVMDYFEKNKASVRKFTRFDILNLQYRLPRWMLQIPYDIANRMNRNMIQKKSGNLVDEIGQENFSMTPVDDACFDLFCIAEKAAQ